MVFVRGCAFPEEHYFDVANQIWYEPLPDGGLRAGFTSIALALAGQVLVFTPKRVGLTFEKGRSFATIEGGKWAGSARAAFAGTIVARNEALVARPTMANLDPYGEGWMIVARPAAANWRTGLVTGAAVAGAFEAWMEAEEVAGCGG
ncbi:MAG: glycine cleavage system protein H [Alphaproteobacteria bacterium]|nr:glycine cleavage system protein H [Alphaproteobacteria bacterium]